MLIEFILPCYNEEKILSSNSLRLLDWLKHQNYHFNWNIILLLNGTFDNSREIAKNLENKHPAIKVFELEEKGKGLALKKYFLSSSADFLLYMDADLAVDLENINDLINSFLRDDYDLIIGSRFLKQSKVERSLIREISSQIYIRLSRLMLQHTFSDLQCGFKGIKKEVFLKLASEINDQFWFFDTELLILAEHHGYRVKEIPVNWADNRYEKRNTKIKLIRDAICFYKNLRGLKKRLKS